VNNPGVAAGDKHYAIQWLHAKGGAEVAIDLYAALAQQCDVKTQCDVVQSLVDDGTPRAMDLAAGLLVPIADVPGRKSEVVDMLCYIAEKLCEYASGLSGYEQLSVLEISDRAYDSAMKLAGPIREGRRGNAELLRVGKILREHKAARGDKPDRCSVA
jgi:hypothetical protein